MKRIFFALFFILIFAFPVLADYTVDNVAVSADVSDRGVAQVTATVQLTFDAVTEQVTVPLPEKEASRVSVGSYRFSTRRSDEGVDVVIRSKNGFAGAQTFQISYRVPYSGGSGGTYSLGILSSRWQRVIGGCSFQVLMPGPLTEPPVILGGYQKELPDNETGLTVTETGFSGAVGQRMAYDALSVEMELPEGYFSVRNATLPVVSVTILAAIMAAVLLLLAVYWRLTLRSDRAEVTPRLLLPEGVLPCQLPMVLDGATCDIAALILEWANLGYLTVSLSRQGTVVLTRVMAMGSERSRAEQRLFLRIFGQKRRVAATPGRFSGAAAKFRASSRRALYRVILDRTGGNPVLVQIPCRILLAVAVGATAVRLLPDGGGFLVLAVLLGVAGFLYSVPLHSVLGTLAAHGRIVWPRGLYLLGVPLLLVLSLLAGALPEMLIGLGALLFSALATAPGPRRSQRGAEAMAQAKGLRAFYLHVSWQRLQVYQGRSSRFFERQLPKAVALGVDKRFARRFERLAVPMPAWLELPREADRSAPSLQKQLAPILRQLREAFR